MMRLSFTATLLLALLLVGCDEQAGETDRESGNATTANVTTVQPTTGNAAPVAAVPVETQEQKMSENPPTSPATKQGAPTELTQRYAEIKAMIGEAKASDVQQCRKVAFGYKACGGPASYLIYSVQGLDEALLLQKVSEYNALAQSESKRLGLMSDCAMVLEPSVTLVGGFCKAGAAGDLY